MSRKEIACWSIAVALVALGRLVCPTRGFDTFTWHGSYEAIAHLFLGVLIGIGVVRRVPFFWFAATYLIVLETGLFLAR